MPAQSAPQSPRCDPDDLWPPHSPSGRSREALNSARAVSVGVPPRLLNAGAFRPRRYPSSEFSVAPPRSSTGAVSFDNTGQCLERSHSVGERTTRKRPQRPTRRHGAAAVLQMPRGGRRRHRQGARERGARGRVAAVVGGCTDCALGCSCVRGLRDWAGSVSRSAPHELIRVRFTPSQVR